MVGCTVLHPPARCVGDRPLGFSENMAILGSFVNRCDSTLWLSGGDAARLTAPVVVPLGAYKWFCGPETRCEDP